MIWILLGILIFGGGGTAPFLNEINVIENNQKRIVVDKTRRSSIKGTIREIKDIFKKFKAKGIEDAKLFKPLINNRTSTTAEFQAVLQKLDDAEIGWEDQTFTVFAELKKKFSPEEWALLFTKGKGDEK